MAPAVDPREDKAPAAALRGREIQALALSATATPPEIPVQEAPQEAPIRHPAEPPDKAIARCAEKMPSKRVSIRMAGASFEFKAAGVSQNKHGIALFLDKDVKLELDIGTEITLTADRQSREVVYVGGFFSFPTIGYNLISFLFKRDD